MPFDAPEHDPLSPADRVQVTRTIQVLHDLPGLRPDLTSYVEQVAVVSEMLSSGRTNNGEPITVHDLRHTDARDDVAWGARAISDACPGANLDAHAVADLPSCSRSS